MSTLICFALKDEAAPFHQAAARHPGVVTRVVGIGRANAEQSVRRFLAAGGVPPQLVLTCGFAGGLNPDLKLGDVVFEIGTWRDEVHASRTENQTGELPGLPLRNRLLAAGARPVKFFCADRIATTAMDKWKLHLDTGADAVEMESAAIHAVCAEHNLPCVTVRVISDTAHEDLPLDFNALARPDKSLDFGRLFLAIARAPGKIGALLELRGKTRLAARRLAASLEQIISP